MTEDKEILKEVWNGKLPICFKLTSDECGSVEPEEVYLMVSRQTYFPLVLDKVQRYFSEYILNQANKSNEIWLDFNGTPLKWHYPVGLLFDLYANDGGIDSQSNNIPWCINVHFDNYPSDLISTQNNKDVIESYFLSTIKEADAIKHKGKIINEMLKKDHKQLWYGVQNDKFDQFWTVNKKLMESIDGADCFKSIPFRIYQVDKPFIQNQFEPVTDCGKRRTLGDLLEFVFGTNYAQQQIRLVLIQGITPSYETSIQWLSEHLSYPDNFLHICIK